MKMKTRDMTLIALFAVLNMIAGKISLTILAVPFTMQSIVCLLAGILLGARRAMLAQALYLLIGLIGLPVFAKGGGFAYVLEPSFGFLIGMLLAGGLVGWIADRFDPTHSELKIWQAMTANLSAQLLIYIFGIAYLYMIINFYFGKSTSVIQAIQIGMIPYLIFDTLKSVLAAVIGPRLRRLTRSKDLVQGTKTAD